jgi:hypothetical protein
MVKEYYTYDNDGTPIKSVNKLDYGWRVPAPESNIEITLNHIIIWMSEHLEDNPTTIDK